MDRMLSTGTRELDDPVLNKGTAFTEAERQALGIEGLLPPAVETIERQLERVMDHLARKASAMCIWSGCATGTRRCSTRH